MSPALLLHAATVVVTDGRGRAARRWRLPGGAVVALLGVLLGVALGAVAIVAHLAWMWPMARQLAEGAHQNRALAEELVLLERGLAPARARAEALEAACSRAWRHGEVARPPAAAAPAARATPDLGQPDLPRARQLQQRLRALGGGADGLFMALGEVQQSLFDRQQLLASTPSIRPVDSPWLSSSFGRRLDPMTGQWMMHKGLDLAGAHGTVVRAPADGTVIWTGWRGGYGKTIVIDHGYALQTHFAHLEAYLIDRGQRVRRGQPIGHMGSTGRSTGSHLHYEVRRAGQPLDPRHFILD